MEFLIAIRHAITGLEKTFPSLQHIADFLASVEDALEWHGHENLGPLPEPTKVDAVVSAPAQEAPAPIPPIEVIEQPQAPIEAELVVEAAPAVVEAPVAEADHAEPNTGL